MARATRDHRGVACGSFGGGVSKARRYAEGTSVTVEKTKTELEALLAKHGATQRMFATDDNAGRAIVQFSMGGRMAQLRLRVDRDGLPVPSQGSWSQGAETPRGWDSWSVKRRQEWVASKCDQREREAWRRLLLLTKAKLELIADGATTFEREFLADILLPDGSTLYDQAAPRLTEAYETGHMPPLLPPGGSS